MANVQVIGAEEVSRLLAELPPTLLESAKKAISESTLNVHKNVSSYRGGLVNRSGQLKRSLRTGLSGTTLDTLTGEIYTKSPYAPIHEKGGVINAKNAYHGVQGGPYLNIPLSANKTSRGVMRENATSVFNSGGYIIKSKTGKFLVMSGAGVPMFVLVKSVTIPARLGMEKSAIDEVPTLLGALNTTLLKGL